MPGSPKWSLSIRLLHQNPVWASPLPHMRYVVCPAHLILRGFIARTSEHYGTKFTYVQGVTGHHILES